MSKNSNYYNNYFYQTDLSDIKDSIIFLDIDGTLVSDGHRDISEIVCSKIKALKSEGNNTIFLCSNSDDLDRDKLFQQQLNIGSVSGVYRKPDIRIKDIAIRKFAETKGGNDKVYTGPFIVIGDKTLIDGQFAKKIGARFIKVKSLIGKNDSLINKIIYFVDEIYTGILKILRLG